MVTTATHDHKRGEDVRARLAMLSERAESWVKRARHWFTLTEAVRGDVDPADVYHLFQTLAGAWPLDLDPADAEGMATFGDRLALWQQKALREAKLRSSWAAPDEAYEQSCEALLRALLDPKRSRAFLVDLTGFVAEIAAAGALNGIAQAVLRCTVPGVPDLYQSCEFWDLSLVDPDNRRPVDFAARFAALADAAPPDALLTDWRSGAIKQAAIAHALRLRAAQPALFAAGSYLPLELRGARADHAIAFLREHGDRAVLVVAPLHCGDAVTDRPIVPPDWWGDTALAPPPGRALPELRLARLLADRPVAVIPLD